MQHSQIAAPLEKPRAAAAGEVAANAPYHVSALETLEAVARITAEWDDLHRRDPDSGVYLSARWIAGIARANPGRWRIYVVRTPGPQGRIVCLFPAAVDSITDSADGRTRIEISPAGRLTLSDRTGFVCDPDHAEAGPAALARHLAGEAWSRFSMRYEPTHSRARAFAAALDPDQFRVSWNEYFINDGKTNYLLCPQISLPDDFETYLATRMGAQTRRSMRRALRTYIDSGEIHITTSTASTQERDLARLFDLWALQWGKEHDAPTLERTIRRHRRFFRLADAIGAFRLTVLWRGDQALGAQACIVDRTRNHLIAKMGTRGLITDTPVGSLLFLHEIQWAIANGFAVFDLGHGNAPYKYSFGAVDQQICYLTIRRRGQTRRTAA